MVALQPRPSASFLLLRGFIAATNYRKERKFAKLLAKQFVHVKKRAGRNRNNFVFTRKSAYQTVPKEKLLEKFLEKPCQIKPFSPRELVQEIKNINPYKVPGYDPITEKIL
jgi:hypothetical protein